MVIVGIRLLNISLVERMIKLRSVSGRNLTQVSPKPPGPRRRIECSSTCGGRSAAGGTSSHEVGPSPFTSYAIATDF